MVLGQYHGQAHEGILGDRYGRSRTSARVTRSGPQCPAAPPPRRLSRAAAGPEANPEALGGLYEDFAEEVFHAGGLGFVEPSGEGERVGEGERGGGEEDGVTVPGDAQPGGGVRAHGIDQQAPGNGREAEGDVAEGGVDGEEVVAAHDD